MRAPALREQASARSCKHKRGDKPYHVDYASLLRRCGRSRALSEGRLVHDRLIRSGLASQVFFGNLVLQMYGDCGAVDDARKWFDLMSHRDYLSWDFMIKACLRNGLCLLTFLVFQQMLCKSIMPDSFICISLLVACDDREALEIGMLVHTFVIIGSFELDMAVANSLINMYSKCTALDDAQRVFDAMPDRDLISWNAIIAGYAGIGCSRQAGHLFAQMHHGRIEPNRVTILTAISACVNKGALFEGKLVHDLIKNTSFDADIVVGTALVNMYSKCGSLDDARKVFDDFSEHDLVSWNAIIAVCAQHEQYDEALQLYLQMQQEGEMPDKVTFTTLLSSCINESAATFGKWVHSQVLVTQFGHDIVLENALINMYGKCGRLEDAWRIFDSILLKDVISWNTMIVSYAQKGTCYKAFQLFETMSLQGILPSKSSFVTVADACSCDTDLPRGKNLHACLITREFCTDIVANNALVNMYGMCSGLEDALRVFYEMPEHDKVTFINILSACSIHAAATEGNYIHACIIECALDSDVVLTNALINFYSKCGRLQDGHKVFHSMGAARNVISWTSLIAAYSQHGQGEQAIQLFEKMLNENIEPNAVTLTSIIFACSHSGLVEEAYRYFQCVTEVHGVQLTLDHYNCMIDLLGRAGRLDEAEKLLNSMPFDATAVSWTTLLGACKDQVDISRAEYAAKNVFRLEPEKVTPYVMLSHIYSSAGRENDALMLMNVIKNGRLQKHLSCNIVELTDIAHKFFADNLSGSGIGRINEERLP